MHTYEGKGWFQQRQNKGQHGNEGVHGYVRVHIWTCRAYAWDHWERDVAHGNVLNIGSHLLDRTKEEVGFELHKYA